MHSEEVLPVENSYFYVLKKDYLIQWLFTDSLDYYSCFDSVMVEKLKSRYRKDFLTIANAKADSLDRIPTWNRQTSYPGGNTALLEFIRKNLKVDKKELTADKMKVFVQFVVDTSGKISDPRILKGINREIDNQVIDLILKMPKWEPYYLFGEPRRVSYALPINLETLNEK
jgi:hypothetical protein